jgi:hypothetical protein
MYVHLNDIMPSAEELRAYADREAMAEDFVVQATRAIEYAARMGYKSELVVVPITFSLKDARALLEKEYPNCRITKRLFSNCFKVSWKERQWGRVWTNPH